MPVEINNVSIRRFADKVKDWAKYLFSKKISIAIVALIGGLSGFFIALKSKPSYTGSLTFVLSPDNNTGNGLLALANQIGLSFGNTSNSAFVGENILLLFQSKKMFEQALFKTLPGTNELLINRIGNEESFFTDWKKDKRLAHLIPFQKTDLDSTGIKDSLVEIIHQHIVTHNFTLNKVEKDLNFYKITVVSHDEEVSRFLPLAMVDVTASFYINIKSSTARRNLQMLSRESDSLQAVLNKSQQSSLSANDQVFNLNTARLSAQTPVKKNEMQTRVLQQAYQTVVQNMEVAKIAVQKETPVYYIIDKPQQGLRAYQPNSIVYAFMGALVSSFFFIFFLLIRKTLHDSRQV